MRLGAAVVCIAIVGLAAAAGHTTASAAGRASEPKAAAAWQRVAGRGVAQDHRAPLIAVLTKRSLITRFQHVCGPAAAAGAGTTSDALTDALPAACLALRGACRHVFRTSLAGVAGSFSRQQFEALHDCAGENGISYVAQDGQVKKAEGAPHAQWWTYRAPTNTTLEQLQQLAAGRLGAAAAAALRPNTAVAGDGSASSTVVTASGGPADGGSSLSPAPLPPAALIQRWILAEVGLAAQQQLQAVGPAATSAAVGVRAADAPLETPQVSAGAAGEGAAGTGGQVSTAAPGSKNQDPGIPVDPQAVAQPDVSVHKSGTSSAAAAGAPSSQAQSELRPLSPAAAEAANEQPGVKAQRLVTALWALDRVDQHAPPLDSTFVYGTSSTPGTGKGVTIYIIDSGIKVDHQEFQPWEQAGAASSSRASAGPDFVDNDGFADDCDGHGTHVASTAAGRSVGIAKEARVVAVRVLDCDGAGSISNVVAALDWVARKAAKPAVVSLSLGVPAGAWSRPLEDVVRHLTDDLGLPVVIAAGNSAKDSCGVSPGRVASAITVGASNMPNKFSGASTAGDVEDLYSWSNTGACLTLFAPGVDIYGACGGPSRCATVNTSSYTWASGTSMAAPHVTGVIAVHLEQQPRATPREVRAALVAAATQGRLMDAAMLPGTPNRLLCSNLAAA